MKRWVIVLGMAVTLSAQTALAQSQPDFSGTWRYSEAKSNQNTAGNWAVVPFPSELTIKQTPTELHLVITNNRQEPVTVVFKLDGSKVTLAMPSGISETGEARLQGATMVITTRRTFSLPGGAGEVVSDHKETWDLAGNLLMVVRSRTLDGDTQSDKAAYEKVK
jgi:hypothetical protein